MPSWEEEVEFDEDELDIWWEEEEESNESEDSILLSSTDPGSLKKLLTRFKKNEKNLGCSQWCIPQKHKKEISKTFYSELQKNDKSVDLNIHIFKSPNLIRFVFFV